METSTLKLYGAFRSGTNYLQALMELNYDVRCLSSEGGWKHVVPPAIFRDGRYADDGIPRAVMSKNPYAALSSMFRYFRARRFTNALCGETWAEFLGQRLVVFDAKQTGMPRYRFSTPIEYWNHVYYGWLSMERETTALIRYEDLLVDPELITDRIAQQMGLARTTEHIVVPDRVVHRLTDTWNRQDADDYMDAETFVARAYYLSEDYVHEYTIEQAESIASRLDPDVLEGLGYAGTPARALSRLSVSHASP